MTLTVSMAYWHVAPEVVRKAVESVLGQTHRDLRLVVIGDGDQPPLARYTDPRLTVLTLPENRGPYYCDAVVLAACDTEWFSIHAADDWSEPQRFAKLLAGSVGVEAVFGGSVEHRNGNVSKRPTNFHSTGSRLHHVGSIATGIYRTDALRRVGGPHPDFRVSYDTMLVHLILRGLRWRQVREFGYHRVVRPDSLTQTPATGLHSEYRNAFRRTRDALYARVISSPKSDWPRLLAPSQEMAERVIADADRLREAMAVAA